jgi:hypothetical protein
MTFDTPDWNNYGGGVTYPPLVRKPSLIPQPRPRLVVDPIPPCDPDQGVPSHPVPPIEVPEDYWVYRVEMVLHEDGITQYDWTFVKLAAWQWGEPCPSDQLQDWVMEYRPDWLITDARLATSRELSKNFADEEI